MKGAIQNTMAKQNTHNRTQNTTYQVKNGQHQTLPKMGGEIIPGVLEG